MAKFFKTGLPRAVSGLTLIVMMCLSSFVSAEAELIFTGDFETGNLSGWGVQDGKLPGALTVQSTIVRAGEFASKHYMKKCSWNDVFGASEPTCGQQPEGLSRPRSQLTLSSRKNLSFQLEKEYWIGVSIYIPRDWIFDNGFKGADALFSTHHVNSGGPGAGTLPQPLSLHIYGNKWILAHKGEAAPVTSQKDVIKYSTPIGDVALGEWVDFVFNFKFSYTNGFMNAWKDGEPIYEMAGSTMTHSTVTPLKNDAFPYLNATIYKANWFNGNSKPEITERTVYFDEIRIATGANGYNVVAPGGATTTPPVEPDSDGDSIPDAQDAFPDDRTEWQDTDSDGIGNNADPDDDNDGLPDDWEVQYGMNSLDASDAASDRDGDTLSNLREFNLNTNPTLTDTDGDGVDDSVDLYPTNPTNPAQTEAELIFTGDFEAGNLSGWSVQDGKLPGALVAQSTIVRTGKFASKHYMRKCSWNDIFGASEPTCGQQPDGVNRPRSQMILGNRIRYDLEKEYWFSVSIYVPDSWIFDNPQNPDILAQAFKSSSGPGAGTNPQPWSLRIVGNSWNIVNKGESAPITSQMDVLQFYQNLGQVERGKWVDWVFNFKFSYTAGFIKVWRDGHLAYKRNGSTITHSIVSSPTNIPPSAAITIYKANWFNGTGKPEITERTAYFDEIRIAAGANGYNVVAPGGTTTPPIVIPDSERIEQTGWSILYADSEELDANDRGASHVFDANPATFWHTDWSSNPGSANDPGYPHDLQLDLGAPYDISGFAYLPRQDITNGRIAAYEFYVGQDGVNWGNPAKVGVFPVGAAETTVKFNTLTGRYVRFRPMGAQDISHPWASVAELNVLGRLSDGSTPVPVDPVESPVEDTVNNNPVAVNDNATTNEGTTITIDLVSNDSDIDGDMLTVTSVDNTSANGNMIVNNGNGTITYTPASGFSGNDNFSYTVSDGNGNDDTATVMVTVTPAPTPDGTSGGGTGGSGSNSGGDSGSGEEAGAGSFDLYALLALLLGGGWRLLVQRRTGISSLTSVATNSPR